MSATGRQELTVTGRQKVSPLKQPKPARLDDPSLHQRPGAQGGNAWQQHNAPHMPRQVLRDDDRGTRVLGERLQAAQSIDGRRRRSHPDGQQGLENVVPRLDSGYSPMVRVKQPLPNLRQGLTGRRSQSVRSSTPPWTAGTSGRRLSPSRFAEREQEPLLESGLARSQRIGALH